MINFLSEARDYRDITQDELAEKVGISRKGLSDIETGKVCPSLETAIKIAGVLSLPLEHLFIMEGTVKRPPVPNTLRFIDLFCGIGGFRFAANNTFAKFGIHGECVFSSDIDKPAQQSYAANFGEVPTGDITKVAAKDIPDFDLLFGGFPCQAFSIIGKQLGFADKTRGTLFFEIARIVKEKRPYAFVLENVKQLVTHNHGKTLKTILDTLRFDLGYCVYYKVINALDCGLPQKRERIIIVGCRDPFVMEWPEKMDHYKPLSEILEPNVDAKYYASEYIVKKRKEAHQAQCFPSIWHENKSGNITSYPYSCALRAGASYNYLLVNGERRLTPREMLRLQGFPDSFKMVVSDSQLRKQAGNAVPVALVERVLEKFIPIIWNNKNI